MTVKMPDGLTYWTADEVAECVPFEDPGQVIYAKLWKFLAEAENPTPMGGDGSNGTVEYPDARMNPDNTDKAPHWWGKLTEDEQAAIAAGYKKDNPDY